MTCLLAGGVLLNIARASDSPHASADTRSE
jgi:hypothetical protein